MRHMITAALGIFALMGLAACADPGAAPAPSAAASPAAARAGMGFDGSFVGPLGPPSETGSRAGSACPTVATPQTLRVSNGQLRGGILFRAFNGPVNADGSFNLTGPDTRFNAAPGTIQGRVTPTGLDGTFTYLAGNRVSCTYSLNGLTRG